MDKKIDNLIKQLKKDPRNINLINQIAILCLRSNGSSSNAYLYFKKAYKIQKNIKTTHNLASYIFYELYNNDKAYKIQKECIEMNPKNHYSYLLFAEILINKKRYLEAINILNRAQRINYTWDARYNLGFCKYMLGDYLEAQKDLLATSKDINNDKELKSLFGLALINYKLGNKEKAYNYLKNMQESDNFENALNNYDIGSLFFLYNDFENATKNTIMYGLDGISLIDWSELGYSIHKTNKELYYSTINKYIDNFNVYIIERENEINNTTNESIRLEKRELIEYYKEEIIKIQNKNKFFLRKPKLNINKRFGGNYFGCYIFGCCINEKLINE